MVWTLLLLLDCRKIHTNTNAHVTIGNDVASASTVRYNGIGCRLADVGSVLFGGPPRDYALDIFDMISDKLRRCMRTMLRAVLRT